MKKLLLIILVCALVLVLAACGNKKESSQVKEDEKVTKAVDENWYDVTSQDLINKTGINLVAPTGSKDKVLNIIDPNGKNPIAELNFTFDGHNYSYRAQMTSKFLPDATASIDKFEQFNISGLYYEWNNFSTTEIQYCDAFVFINNEEGIGYIMWQDVAPGILYTLSTDKDATVDDLKIVADEVFIPMQGDEQ